MKGKNMRKITDLFKPSPKYIKRGYILVLSYNKNNTIINNIFDRNIEGFAQKKIFSLDSISDDCYFPSILYAFCEINFNKKYKRFLASPNIEGIYYVEITTYLNRDNIIDFKTTSTKLFYKPSEMKLYVSNPTDIKETEFYTIQCGSFMCKGDAIDLSDKLKDYEINDVNVIYHENYYKVHCGMSNDASNIKKIEKKLDKLNLDTFIIKICYKGE